MQIFILAACVGAGLVIYFKAIRPLLRAFGIV